MFTPLQLSVQKSDFSYIKSFLQPFAVQGKLRQVMYGACLFDNVDVASFCVDNGWLFDKATIAVALENGSTKVADFLFLTATIRGYTNILEKCAFVISNSFFVKKENAVVAGHWLVQKGYVFVPDELLSLICDDSLELFKIAFHGDVRARYDIQKMTNDCIRYKAYSILEFLQAKLDVVVESSDYEFWKRRAVEV
jgi:hypothetical protein